jgi:predicted MPP superfamily phosphohydrolase
MKIALASDLHLEFGTISLENEGADVLILSGDIIVADRLGDRDVYNIMGEASQSNRYHTFMQECSARFKHVIYVAGNHEHYDGDFATTIPKLKEKFSYLTNVYILDKEMKTIDDVTFIGGTLWTNMNNMDSLTLYQVKTMMNDFRIVKNSNRKVSRKVPLYKKDEKGDYVLDEKGFMIQDGFKFKEDPSTFCPEDAASDHVAMMQFIEHTIKDMNNEKFVIVGHHAPSKLSTKPQYEKDVILNGAYSSDLSEFMLDHPQIKLWTHGHTHHEFEYVIGETKVVCNPRGYIGYEANATNFKLKYWEV